MNMKWKENLSIENNQMKNKRNDIVWKENRRMCWNGENKIKWKEKKGNNDKEKNCLKKRRK